MDRADGKTVLGEAAAGIVYHSDVAHLHQGLGVVTIPPDLNVVAVYPVARVRGAAHPQLAQAFIDLLLSDTGQKQLADEGFLPLTDPQAKLPDGERPR